VKSTLSEGIKFVINRDDNIVWLKLDKEFFNLDKPIMLAICYVVPTASSRQTKIETDIFDDLITDIANFQNEYSENVDFIICGDMNARTRDELDFVSDEAVSDIEYMSLPLDYVLDKCSRRVSQDTKPPSENGWRLLDMCKMCGLRILNGRCGTDKGCGKFTCHAARGSSVVDYVCVSANLLSKCVDFEVIDDVQQVSDHCLLSVRLAATIDKAPPCNNATKCERLRWDANLKQKLTDNILTVTNDLDAIVNNINNVNNEGINVVISNYTEALLKIAELLFKKSYYVSDKPAPDQKLPPYYTQSCKEKRNAFFESLNMYRRSGTDNNRVQMIHARKLFKAEARTCRLNYSRENTRRLVEAKSNNAKLYWKLLKSRNRESTPNISNSSLYVHFNNLSLPTDDSSILSKDIDDYLQEYDCERQEMAAIYAELDNVIQADEIYHAIKQLKGGKSAGPDMLINELFMYGSELIVPSLTCMFNNLLLAGYFPSQWSEGIIVPLHKGGNRDSADNYRGITLLSILGKLFTKVLNNRLSHWSDTYSIIIEAQPGFRKIYSTVDNLFVVHGLISHIC
jgi:hypothetical protein